MLRIYGGIGVDLKREVISTGVFKEAVHGIKKLVTELEEPLPVRNKIE